MDILYDIPPFNMTSGSAFLVFYALVAVACFGAVVFAQRGLGSYGERRVPRGALAVVRPGAPYRTDDGSLSPRCALTVGCVPCAEEIPMVAYLKAGLRGMANTLISVAFAEGSLSPDPEHGGDVIRIAASARSEPAQIMLHERLRALGGTTITVEQLRCSARAVAEAMEADTLGELESAGLLRSERAVRSLQAIMWATGGLLLAIGAIRMMRGISLGRPVAFLLMEMVGVAVASGFLSMRPLRESRRTRDYLGWLEDATASVRMDVRAGRRGDPESVGIAVAMASDSAAAVTGIAVLASVLIPVPVVPTASFGETDVSSSCSTASCGGGSCGSSSGCGG
jgi:uncharacterized protein (TIGR04222 family)